MRFAPVILLALVASVASIRIISSINATRRMDFHVDHNNAGDVCNHIKEDTGVAPAVSARPDPRTLSTTLELDQHAQAEQHYKLALRYFESGDLERTGEECRKALELDPDHIAADGLETKAVWMMIRMRKGLVVFALADLVGDDLLEGLREKLHEAKQAYKLGWFEAAEEELETVLSHCARLPKDSRTDILRTQASYWLTYSRLDRP